MTVLDSLPRTAVKLNAYSRHMWGPDTTRTVRLCVIDTPDGLLGRTIGSDNGKAVVLDEAPVASVNRRRVELVDGRVWEVTPIVGCGCKIPSVLRGLDPRKVPSVPA